MKTIAMAATKGGVAKTTLAACLSVQACKLGAKVAMLDLDPQGSLGQWHELRQRPDNPKCYTDVECLADDVASLARAGFDFVFIDTPPGNVDIVREAVEAADYALIPARVSALDVLAVEPAVAACKDAGKPFGFILSAYDPSWKLSASAEPYLKEAGPVLSPPIRYRAAYASAMTLGRTGPESQDGRAAKACREEISALWQSILGAISVQA
jgi:chromosome partitioning protein